MATMVNTVTVAAYEINPSPKNSGLADGRRISVFVCFFYYRQSHTCVFSLVPIILAVNPPVHSLSHTL